jgi:hypothetical protein
LQTTVIRLTSLEEVAGLRFSSLCTAIGLLSASRTFAMHSDDGRPGHQKPKSAVMPEGMAVGATQCLPRAAIVDATGTVLPLLNVYIQSVLRAEGAKKLPRFPSSHFIAQLTSAMHKVQVSPRCTTSDATGLISHLNLLAEWCVPPMAPPSRAHSHPCCHKLVLSAALHGASAKGRGNAALSRCSRPLPMP